MRTRGTLVVPILAIVLPIPTHAAPRPAAAPEAVVSALDFENGTWSPWFRSGGRR